MPPAGESERSRDELEAIAWKFLGSEFTGASYAEWPIDRRIDAYLLHHGMLEIVNNRHAYEALLQRIMANIGPALRRGILAPPHC